MAALGVNTSEYDFSGMTAAEKLQLLREIRRICEEMMAQGKWDPGKAQEIADEHAMLAGAKTGNWYIDANRTWGEKWSLVISGVLVVAAASVLFFALGALALGGLGMMATASVVAAVGTAGAIGGKIAIAGGVCVIGAEIAFRMGAITASQRQMIQTAGVIATIIGGITYIISAAYDPVIDNGTSYPTFEAFKKANPVTVAGNHWHHIVEQNQIGHSGFPPELIHNTRNLIELTKANHDKITGYYASIRDFSEGLRVREWLIGKSFEEQYQFGIEKIKELFDIIVK